MGLIVTTTSGLVVWVVLWAMGVKGFDGFILTLTMVVVASMARILVTPQAGEDH